ncbi:MAG: hypothetical protein EOP54_17790, partial [Sphingobacteriales bacterium]
MKIDRIKTVVSTVVLALTVFIIACSKKSGTDNGPVPTNFDKAAMLTNYADNLIIPAYTDLKT